MEVEKLKAELEEIREHSEATMKDFADLLGVEPHHCTAWGDLYRRIGELKAELAQCWKVGEQHDLAITRPYIEKLIAAERQVVSLLNDRDTLMGLLAKEKQRAAQLRDAIDDAIKRCDHECSPEYIADHLTTALMEAGT